MSVKLTYSEDADALYIRFGRKWRSHKTAEVPRGYSERLVDYGKDGEPVGVEILGTRSGIDVDGLPMSEEIAALLQQDGFRLVAADEQKAPTKRGVA